MPYYQIFSLWKSFFVRLWFCIKWNNGIKENYTKPCGIAKFCFHISEALQETQNERTTGEIGSFCIDSTFFEFTRSVFPSISYSSDIFYRFYGQCNSSGCPLHNGNACPCSVVVFHLNIELKQNVFG